MDFILGIDVSKAVIDVALLGGPKPRTAQFKNAEAGFTKLAAWLQRWGAERVHACMEATGVYGEALALWLHARGHTVSIVNPLRIKGYAQSELLRSKTDTLDAGLIARFCREKRPDAWEPPSPQERELQALSRRVEALEQMRQQELARLETTSSEAVAASIRGHAEYLAEQIKKARKEIDSLTGGGGLGQRRGLLQSITGIGAVCSALLLAEVFGARDRFGHQNQAVAFVGLSPKQHQSGTTERRARLSKIGSPRVRRALYMAAMSAIRTNPVVRQLAERLRAKGKPEMVILGAAMRKLVVLSYGVLKTGTPFDPSHATAG